MAKRQRLTNNSDETDLASLLSGDTVFSIPYFQRAYKWETKRLNQLNEDLLRLVDQSTDSHFLGAVIIHGRRGNPSEPHVYEVIDGQQRLTTVFLYLCAIVRTLCKHQEFKEAAGLFLKYLVIGRPTELLSNVKLHPCKDDRAQLNLVIEDLLEDEAFHPALQQFTFRPLPAGNSGDHGRVWNNYKAALRFFQAQVEEAGLPRLRDLYTALLEFVSLVQIDVWDPTNGPKIFDSLNSRQHPMTTGDLVRNEIFSRVAHLEPDQIDEIDRNSWQPFYAAFKTHDSDLFDAYFFPFGLIRDPNVRKSEVYAALRDQWTGMKDPARIIASLSEYQDAFLDLCRGTNRQNHSSPVQKVFRRLHSAGAPTSTYPFLMRLSNGLRDKTVAEGEGLAMLGVLESFLVRRAICGHEPTGLHSVFKRLWPDMDGDMTATRAEKEIRKHRTVTWPGDDEVKSAVTERPLYPSAITKYVLLEWNRHLGGDVPNIEPWIEHVLPDSPVDAWFELFSKAEHELMKDRLANLLPLSSEMNRDLGNREYSAKRPVYEEDSGFKAARQFAKTIARWDPAALQRRSEELAAWAVKHWKH